MAGHPPIMVRSALHENDVTIDAKPNISQLQPVRRRVATRHGRARLKIR